MIKVTDLGNGWVRTESVGYDPEPLGSECRACNPDCPGTLEDCERCVKESIQDDEK